MFYVLMCFSLAQCFLRCHWEWRRWGGCSRKSMYW